jgi:CheY-like chemotaxis protein
MAEWLRATFPDLRILFTSGYTDDAVTREGLSEEGVDFLPKPYTPSTLAHKVREILDAKTIHV